GQVGLGRDHDVGRLVLDHDDAANAVLDRGVFAFRINANVDGASVGHRVVVVDPEVLDEKEFLFYGDLKETKVDDSARPELGRIEFCQAIVEPFKPGDLGVDGEASVFVDAAIVFVKAEGRRLKRTRSEITADVFLGDAVQLGVRFKRGGRLRRRFLGRFGRRRGRGRERGRTGR